jgi:CMP-N,N'-diacetyllegionaminic acid synthase
VKSKDLIIIPARGGSKGVPGKNSMEFDGKPLITYSIECALELKNDFHIVVSSDDSEIQAIARSFTEVIIHERSAEIAKDDSPITETITAILMDFEAKNINPDKTVILQPTSPIRTKEQVMSCIEILDKKTDLNCVISVVSMDDIHPARMYWQTSEFEMQSILPEFEQTRRQEIPPALYRNGSIYAFRTSEYKIQKKVMMHPAAPLIMPLNWLLNIDSPRDVLIAKAILPAWNNGLI